MMTTTTVMMNDDDMLSKVLYNTDDDDDYRNLSNNYRIQSLSGAKNDEEQKVASEIKSHIFYVMEYRDFCLNTLKHFQITFLSVGVLRDLIESSHIYMRMLDRHCNGGKTTLLVQKKKRKVKRRKRKGKGVFF